MINIGERLKEERLRLKLSQEDICTAADINRRSQSNYESGQRSPDALYLSRIAELGIDVNYILTGKRAAADLPTNVKGYLLDFVGTYLDVQEVMKGQPKDKIFETAYNMHLKILARIEANKVTKSKSKKAVNE